MNARTIPRTAIDTSLKIARVPFDVAIRWLPGNGTGARPTARLALDRTDASLRGFAGTILGDSMLRGDAQQRRVALKQREQAQELRGEAQRNTERADSRLRERRDQVDRQRAQAEQRAKSRRQDADREREQTSRRADETKRRRLAASNSAAARADEALNERAPKARLDTLDAKAEALRKKEEALRARDEARRLRQATGRAKAERKNKT